MTNRTVATLLLILAWGLVHAQAPIILSGQGLTASENIQHPYGNIFDQVLLTGPSIKLRAIPNQITPRLLHGRRWGHCASRILGPGALPSISTGRPSFLQPAFS